MILRKVELSDSEASRALNDLSDSRVQRLLHNHLFEEIERCRTALEKASGEVVVALQAEVRSLRTIVAFIHKADSKEIKSFYENPNKAL